MSDKSQQRAAAKARRNDTGHKFAVGSIVALIERPGQSLFKITGLLPDGGAGLQYRIKSEREDYERVATEALLTPVRK